MKWFENEMLKVENSGILKLKRIKGKILLFLSWRSLASPTQDSSTALFFRVCSPGESAQGKEYRPSMLFLLWDTIMVSTTWASRDPQILHLLYRRPSRGIVQMAPQAEAPATKPDDLSLNPGEGRAPTPTMCPMTASCAHGTCVDTYNNTQLEKLILRNARGDSSGGAYL